MCFVVVFLCEYKNFVLTFQFVFFFFLMTNNIQRKGNKASQSLSRDRIVMSYNLGEKCKHLKCHAVDEMPRNYHANIYKKNFSEFLLCVYLDVVSSCHSVL